MAKAPGFIPEAHRKGVHLLSKVGVARTGQISPKGTVEQWERWDGSVDANVRLRPVRFRLKPQDMDRAEVVQLMAEFERAVRLNEAARRSGDAAAHRLTARKVVEVKDRLAGVLS